MSLSRVRLFGLAAVAIASAFRAQAEPNMTPDYEVKVLLDPTVVLGSDQKLTSAVLSTFSMPTTVTKMNVQFLDTDGKGMYNAGWSPRIRKIEDKDKFELTYKKRYPITNGNIDAALTEANIGGFDASDDNYDAQVEWGYQKQTLSISLKKSSSSTGYNGMDLPDLNDSRDMLIDDAPGKFDDWLSNGWGTDNLAISRIFGPVLAKRSIGTWSGLELFVEVWPIRNSAGTGIEYIVEASFKTANRADASLQHDNLIAFVQERGWFLEQDSLKTQLIMERY